MTDSRNHVAVVTGAAGDIGRAIAEQLSVTHATVVLVDIDAAALDKALSCFPCFPAPTSLPKPVT